MKAAARCQNVWYFKERPLVGDFCKRSLKTYVLFKVHSIVFCYIHFC